MSFFSCLRFSPHPQQSYTWPESCSKMLEDPTYFCFRLSLSTGLGTLLGAGITGDIYTREVTLMVCYHCVCLTTINMATHKMHIFALYLSFTALIFQQQRLVFKWVESLKCFKGSLASKFENSLIVSSQSWRKKTLEMFQAWVQISQQEALKFKHLLWNWGN